MKKITLIAFMLFTALSHAQGIRLNGTVSAENNQIKNLADPVDAQDAVTKNYTYSKDKVDQAIIELQTQITELNNFIDNDSDNFTENDGDCDDSNAQVYPGAIEIEDGLDNNCDGFIDEGFSHSETINDIDGNTYDYLAYGDQVWTLNNAEMETYRDGTLIPQIADNTEWANLTTGAWCYYNNDQTKGKLYNWYAVMGIHDNDDNTENKEFAPEGWHVSSDNEWSALEEHLILNGFNYDETLEESKIAKAMSSQSAWNIDSNSGVPGNNQSLNNSSGFNAFPQGSRGGGGFFYNWGRNTEFWSTNVSNPDKALIRNISSFNSFLARTDHLKYSGLSVRFVRDVSITIINDDN
tara:strand:- start:698 stop:1753 length:1056 start_codon:yes stop_codon:yes gene_type:complete